MRIMEKKMETTIMSYIGIIGIMEKKMDGLEEVKTAVPKTSLRNIYALLRRCGTIPASTPGRQTTDIAVTIGAVMPRTTVIGGIAAASTAAFVAVVIVLVVAAAITTGASTGEYH